MLKTQEIQIAQSQRRERMAEIQKADEITDDARTELRNVTEAYQNAEPEYRAALILEEAERAQIKEPDKAGTDFEAECRQFDLTTVIVAQLDGKQLEGREAEVTEELETRDGAGQKGIRVPWEAIATRADTTVTAPDNSSGELASRPTMQALERVFDQSAAHKLGFKAMQVTGQPRFPELVSGASAAWVGEGDGTDAAAINTTVATPAMHTLTARYLVSRQAVRQNTALEPMLRRDLSEVVREAIDLATFQGADADNQPAGIENTIPAGQTEDLENVVLSYEHVLKYAVQLMESAKLTDLNGIHCAGLPFMLRGLLGTSWGDGLTQMDMAKKVVDRFVFANNVATPVGDSGSRTGTMYFAAPAQIAHVVNWGSPELVIDPYSESKSGKIAMTIFSFMDILAQRLSTHWIKVENVAEANV